MVVVITFQYKRSYYTARECLRLIHLSSTKDDTFRLVNYENRNNTINAQDFRGFGKAKLALKNSTDDACNANSRSEQKKEYQRLLKMAKKNPNLLKKVAGGKSSAQSTTSTPTRTKFW